MDSRPGDGDGAVQAAPPALAAMAGTGREVLASLLLGSSAPLLLCSFAHLLLQWMKKQGMKHEACVSWQLVVLANSCQSRRHSTSSQSCWHTVFWGTRQTPTQEVLDFQLKRFFLEESANPSSKRGGRVSRKCASSGPELDHMCLLYKYIICCINKDDTNNTTTFVKAPVKQFDKRIFRVELHDFIVYMALYVLLLL